MARKPRFTLVGVPQHVIQQNSAKLGSDQNGAYLTPNPLIRNRKGRPKQ